MFSEVKVSESRNAMRKSMSDEAFNHARTSEQRAMAQQYYQGEAHARNNLGTTATGLGSSRIFTYDSPGRGVNGESSN